MSSGGSITLADIAGKRSMLAVACSRCERRGRLSIAKLIGRHGGGMRLTDLREILAGDCSHVGAASIHDRCGVHYPQLPGIFLPSRPS